MPNTAVLKKTIARCRERGVIIPTFEQMRHPEKIPGAIQRRLRKIGLWDVSPLNLFRITWKNDISSGLFGPVNALEIPRVITRVRARIVGLLGKFYPTGAHKVGAAFGCLVPRLINGEFDPTAQKAVWPSTGNYCRGGAFDSVLLDCVPVAILPEGMSKERFEWLKGIGAEVIATPGTESNVKEIYDKCWEIRRTRPECVIFNQFEEFGNPVWHYEVTGPAVEEAFRNLGPGLNLAAYISATGSAGTIAAGDYLRGRFPHIRVTASEALQCPTLLYNGFGAHRIEGIGDKHVPWIHNVRNTDAAVAIDDESCMQILRLFNEKAGHALLKDQGVPASFIRKLPLLGISGISNMLSAIKIAKYFELTENDVVMTIFTDSTALYGSRVEELRAQYGEYKPKNALYDRTRYLDGIGPDHVMDLGYYDRKRLHNLKYFTWVEQQGKTSEDLNRLWAPSFWEEVFRQGPVWNRQIDEFNRATGVLKRL
ncbi:MAG: pyridoxal-5-phosphate-dependent protein subunit beta [Candidatus Lindowbacteria bacterium RIFCSPLOWO2_12_FULL_62_27]|nr:MAG: pyridoxal-5-phosphate-dependent protein subunit beta [Candidatus Lindowbacteria bacterium RIFCSPLOWO2_12_FULL_62_27]OGH63434.1 MAG: pyridoxal-5-phosphate-dependent protein subunit beta [Candidatus Lindowbacteria bacterium RIFCSPLOWO2_02_FULL_62_12]